MDETGRKLCAIATIVTRATAHCSRHAPRAAAELTIDAAARTDVADQHRSSYGTRSVPTTFERGCHASTSIVRTHCAYASQYVFLSAISSSSAAG
jgi:hypothetical protein